MFWHEYPNTNNWILAENDGTIGMNEIYKINSKH